MEAFKKKCVLSDKECSDCGACNDRCTLDPSKICDNCFRCLELDGREYAEIPIDSVILEAEEDGEADDALDANDRARYVGERLWHVQTIPGWHASRRRQ